MLQIRCYTDRNGLQYRKCFHYDNGVLLYTSDTLQSHKFKEWLDVYSNLYSLSTVKDCQYIELTPNSILNARVI